MYLFLLLSHPSPFMKLSCLACLSLTVLRSLKSRTRHRNAHDMHSTRYLLHTIPLNAIPYHIVRVDTSIMIWLEHEHSVALSRIVVCALFSESSVTMSYAAVYLCVVASVVVVYLSALLITIISPVVCHWQACEAGNESRFINDSWCRSSQQNATPEIHYDLRYGHIVPVVCNTTSYSACFFDRQQAKTLSSQPQRTNSYVS